MSKSILKKDIIGWSFYDWANSAFATTVIAGFFPLFFSRYCNEGVGASVITFRLGMGNAIAGIIIALLAPLLGAVADKGSAKKRFLAFFAFMGIVMTMALFFVSKGNWVFAIVMYALALMGFSGGNIFYDAFLPSVASPKQTNIVSSLGYSLGYLGGGLLFAINVLMVLKPESFGLADASQAIRVSFLTVGVWWAVFSIPVFLFVKEPQGKPISPGLFKAGFIQLIETFRELKYLKTVGLFLAAYWLYIDGVGTVIRMAVNYGISIRLPESDLIKALLITQFVGFPCAIAFGWLGNRFGTRRAIFLGIAVYLCICIRGAFIKSSFEFYLLAAAIGLVQGGVQALSRSLYSRLIPVDKSAEYFGFYNFVGKFAAIIGPFLVGFTAVAVKGAGYTEDFAMRMSIVSISVLFLAGGILLSFVKEPDIK